jgi:hypothetical protein
MYNVNMAKKKTKLEKIKMWLDKNPKIKSAINTFWTGFTFVFILQIQVIDWNNLSGLLENGAIVGILLAALRAGLIAGASAVGKMLTSK